MTRKRFIKLLMSHGIKRNEAVKKAADYNSRNVPYETAYARETRNAGDRLAFAIAGLGISATAASMAFRSLSSEYRAMSNAISGIGRC